MWASGSSPEIPSALAYRVQHGAARGPPSPDALNHSTRTTTSWSLDPDWRDVPPSVRVALDPLGTVNW